MDAEVTKTHKLKLELADKRKHIAKCGLAGFACYMVGFQLGKMAEAAPGNSAMHLKPELRYGIIAVSCVVLIYVLMLVYSYCTTAVVMTKEDFDMNRGAFRKLIRVDREFKIGKITLDRFYERFCWIDIDGSNSIELEEFLRYFELEDMFFTRRIFRIIDVDNSGALDFVEFVLSLYNYCTFDWEGLVRFTFELFDADGDESLDVEELENLVQLVHGRKIDDRVSAVMERIEQDQHNKGGALGFEDFQHFCRLFPVLVYPLVRIQMSMRQKLLGEGFWINESLRMSKRLQSRGKKNVLHSLVDLGLTKVEHVAHGMVRRLSTVVQHGRRMSTMAAGKAGLLSQDAMAAAAAAAAARKGRGRFAAAKRALSIKIQKVISGGSGRGGASTSGGGGGGGDGSGGEQRAARATSEKHVRAGAVMAVKPHSLKIKREALKRSAAEANNVKRFGNAAKVQAAYVPEQDAKYVMAWKHTMMNLEAASDNPKLLDAEHFERFMDAMTGHVSSIKVTGAALRLSSWASLALRCGLAAFVLLLVAVCTDWWIHARVIDLAMPQSGGGVGGVVGGDGGPLRANATRHRLAQGWGAFRTSGDVWTSRAVPENAFCLALKSVGYCSTVWATQALLVLTMLFGSASIWYLSMGATDNEGAWTPCGVEVMTMAGVAMAGEAFGAFLAAVVFCTAYISALQQSNPLIDAQTVSSGGTLYKQTRACPWTNVDSNKVMPHMLLHEVSCTFSVGWSFGLGALGMLLAAAGAALLWYDDSRDTSIPEVTVSHKLRELRDDHIPWRLLRCCGINPKGSAVAPDDDIPRARRQPKTVVKVGPGRITIVKQPSSTPMRGQVNQGRKPARGAWQ